MTGGVSKGVGTQTVSTLLAGFRCKFATLPIIFFLFQQSQLVQPGTGHKISLINMGVGPILKF